MQAATGIDNPILEQPTQRDAPAAAGRAPGSIDRRSRLSEREFVHEYALACRPVIVADAAARWPAMHRFTWDFFRDRYGHLARTIGDRTYTLSETIDLIMASTPEHPAPYPFNLNVEAHFPELLADLQPELAYGASDRVNHPLLPRLLMRGTEVYELFFGGDGSAFPRVHYDALWLHTQITQIRGSKEFFLYPPDQGACMYPHPENEKMSLVDFTAPDPHRFPRFFEARPIVVTVNEGETIFFPAGWWHATRIHEPCISLGKVQLNASNWNRYADDVRAFWNREHPLFATAARWYLGALGRLMDAQERRGSA
jgi:hypothetical protein